MKVSAMYWTVGETEWGRVYSCVICSRNVLPLCPKKMEYACGVGYHNNSVYN